VKFYAYMDMVKDWKNGGNVMMRGGIQRTNALTENGTKEKRNGGTRKPPSFLLLLLTGMKIGNRTPIWNIKPKMKSDDGRKEAGGRIMQRSEMSQSM
jgi:hypothetical protein